MKTKTTKEYRLTEQDVKLALAQYISAEINEPVVEGEITLKVEQSRHEIAGYDPHDCYYRYEFDGFTVTTGGDSN